MLSVNWMDWQLASDGLMLLIRYDYYLSSINDIK
jgi:hypothetical protein